MVGQSRSCPGSGQHPEAGSDQAGLRDSEINVGLQTFFDAALRVWIGDPMNGFEASGKVETKDLAWSTEGAVTGWLHEAAYRCSRPATTPSPTAADPGPGPLRGLTRFPGSVRFAGTKNHRSSRKRPL